VSESDASAALPLQGEVSETPARTVCLTLKFRVKDKHAARLSAQARAASFVWNFCNETQRKAARSGRLRSARTIAGVIRLASRDEALARPCSPQDAG
jgi:hypothetical protein